MTNIRPFREEPNLLNKIGVALGYIVLGWVVATYPIGGMGNLLSIFFLLGFLVWIFVLRKRDIKYFVRYHVMQALLFNVALAAVLWLLDALLSLISSIPGIKIIAELTSITLFVPLNVANIWQASVVAIVIMTASAVLAIYCLRGKYAELPWVTDGVRYWM